MDSQRINVDSIPFTSRFRFDAADKEQDFDASIKKVKSEE